MNRQEKKYLKDGLRILAQIIVRDIYSRWRGEIKKGSYKNNLNKVKENAKS